MSCCYVMFVSVLCHVCESAMSCLCMSCHVCECAVVVCHICECGCHIGECVMFVFRPAEFLHQRFDPSCVGLPGQFQQQSLDVSGL